MISDSITQKRIELLESKQKEGKDKRIFFNANSNQEKAINKIVEMHKYKSVSEYLRKIIFTRHETETIPKDYLFKIFLIKKHGDNINTIAKELNFQMKKFKEIKYPEKIEEKIKLYHNELWAELDGSVRW